MNFLVWMIVAIAFGVIEIFTVGFFMMFFSLGALLTSLVAIFMPDQWLVQLTVFLVSSVFFLMFGRPLVRNVLRVKERPAQLSNSDSLLNQQVLVLEEVTRYGGKVKLIHAGEVWTAYLANDESVQAIPVGHEAKVTAIDGAKLVVTLHPPVSQAV